MRLWLATLRAWQKQRNVSFQAIVAAGSAFWLDKTSRNLHGTWRKSWHFA